MSWVLDHSTAEGTERLVLLSLANHAGPSPVDGAWESYPGVETIQKEANLQRLRTVQEVLNRLIASGHIERIVNGAPDSRIQRNRRPNLYRILVARGRGFGAASNGKGTDKDPDTTGAAAQHPYSGAVAQHPNGDLGVPSDDIQGCRDASSRGAVSRHTGVPPHGTQTVNEPSVEPSVEPKTVVAVPATAPALALVEPPPIEPGGPAPQTLWDLFWQRYPRKTHRADAVKAWRRLIGSGVRDIDILAGLDRWVAYWQAAGTREQFIKHPANWLDKRDFNEPTPALDNRRPGGDRKTDQLRSVLTDFVNGETA